MESKEYTTIIKCERKLEFALKADRDIAHFLHVNAFITKEIYDDSNGPTSVLVAAIRDRVQLNPENYHKFVGYLHKNKRQYGDIIDILDKEYNDYQPAPFKQGIDLCIIATVLVRPWQISFPTPYIQLYT